MISTLLSLFTPRPHCGIQYFASILEQDFARYGLTVIACDARSMRSIPSEVDAIVAQLEIGEDLRCGTVFALLRVLLLSKLKRSRKIIILHSVFHESDLRLRGFLARKAAIVAQWLFFYAFYALSRIAVTTTVAQERLRRYGIEADLVELGRYGHRAVVGKRIDKRIFAVIGHPASAKRYDLAVKAFAHLPIEDHESAMLYVVGGDADQDPEGACRLREALNDVTPSRYRFTGALDRPQFDSWLDEVGIALLPYERRVSASAVLSEVIERGCALIVSAHPIFAPFVSAGAAIEVQDWETEASAVMHSLIEDEARFEELRAAMRSYRDSRKGQTAAAKLLGLFTEGTRV